MSKARCCACLRHALTRGSQQGAANEDRASVGSLFDKTAEDHAAGLSEMTLLRQTQTKAIVLLERVVKFSSWGKGIDAGEL